MQMHETGPRAAGDREAEEQVIRQKTEKKKKLEQEQKKKTNLRFHNMIDRWCPKHLLSPGLSL